MPEKNFLSLQAYFLRFQDVEVREKDEIDRTCDEKMNNLHQKCPVFN